MAVALTSFVQPMLVVRRSSDASVTNNSANKASRTPAPSDSEDCHSVDSESSDFRMASFSPSNDPAIGNEHCKESASYFNINLDSNGDGEFISPPNTLYIAAMDSNDGPSSENDDASVSRTQCRYCYSDISREHNVSQCHCTGSLCKECLIKELQLTYGRRDKLLQCTVCKNEYAVETEFTIDLKRHCRSFCTDFVVHCGLKDEQYLLDSVGGKIGFVLVILGINTWILSTSLLFAFPPNGCPVELYYMVALFDFLVGISTIWFIQKCRYLSPLLLSGMYFVRFVYILLGWMPSVNLLNIHRYHHEESDHVAILGYFLAFSLLAAAAIAVFTGRDLYRQIKRFRTKYGRLVLNKNTADIKIDVQDLLCGAERDEF